MDVLSNFNFCKIPREHASTTIRFLNAPEDLNQVHFPDLNDPDFHIEKVVERPNCDCLMCTR